MQGSEVAPWVGVGLLVCANAVGYLVAINRANQQRGKVNGIISEKLTNLENGLTKLNGEFGSIDKSLGSMREHCAQVTSRFSEQISTLQKQANDKK